MLTAMLQMAILAAAVAAASGGCSDETAGIGTIHVYVRDLEDDGVVRFVLFDSSEGFPMGLQDARSVQDAVVSCGKAAMSFEGLPRGEYAVVVLYSENGHFPEPGTGGGPGGPPGCPGTNQGGGDIMIGMSGDSEAMPPTFEECSVSLSTESLALQVELRTPSFGGGPPAGGGPPGGPGGPPGM